eukprot:Polyplicarium_translucidae@DN2185_c0_g1_i3.p1
MMALWSKTASEPLLVLPHVRVLTVGELDAERCFARMHCPNIQELFIRGSYWEPTNAVPQIVNFVERHRNTLNVFIGPTSDEDWARVGRVSGIWPDIEMGVLMHWQYVEIYDVACDFPPGKHRLPKMFKVPEGVTCMRAVRVSCKGMASLASLPPSMTADAVVENIRALYVVNVGLCQVMAKLGELNLQLYFLKLVAPTTENYKTHPCCCATREHGVRRGLWSVDELHLLGASLENLPVFCPLIRELLRGHNGRLDSDGSLVLTRPGMIRTLTESREADLCRAIVNRPTQHRQTQIQAWVAVDADCDHRKVSWGVENCDGDFAWFAKRCSCNLSWNFKREYYQADRHPGMWVIRPTQPHTHTAPVHPQANLELPLR